MRVRRAKKHFLRNPSCFEKVMHIYLTIQISLAVVTAHAHDFAPCYSGKMALDVLNFARSRGQSAVSS